MAAKSKGFFCAKTIAVEASVRMSQRRIHDDCNALPGAWTWNLAAITSMARLPRTAGAAA
jgi:hypothetical protein